MTVSYTHLDVYKRQTLAAAITILVLAFLIVYIPVSYTHLDVYKRQDL